MISVALLLQKKNQKNISIAITFDFCGIHSYFPIVQEIRNRHWLQVMAVTGSSFQLEAAVFKLSHLLDIGLIT
jgi:hypothetical protein